MRFVSIVIDSPSSLNKVIMSILNLSTLGPLALCTMASPSWLAHHIYINESTCKLLFYK